MTTNTTKLAYLQIGFVFEVRLFSFGINLNSLKNFSNREVEVKRILKFYLINVKLKIVLIIYKISLKLNKLQLI